MVWSAIGLLALAAGCGDGDGENAAQGGPDACARGCGGEADSGEPSEVEGPWQPLVMGDWEIPANTETYRCVRFTLDRDVYISSLRPVAPLGTHHTVLTVDDAPTEPDGITVCDVGTNARRAIMGSGVGTNDFTFPSGIAARVRAGEQLVLNLHLFNAADEPLSGTSGVLMQAMAESEVEDVAEALLAGPTDLNIPPGHSVQRGTCTMDRDVTLLAVLPHMHQLAVHMKGVAQSSIDGEVMLHDLPYTFDDQLIYPIEPVRMAAGDMVEIECTYENTTDETLQWGDSSLAEMCFLGLWRYPASDDSYFICNE